MWLCLALIAAPSLQPALDAVEAAAKADRRPVVVFDLDSTLFDNGPRTKHILLEIAHGDRDLERHVEALGRLPDTGLPYLVTDILKKAGIEDPAVQRIFVSGWKSRFFASRYATLDRPLPGAVGFVRAVVDRGATVVYLTGRDAPGLGAGTVESLLRFGFPALTPNAVLVMKPTFEQADEAFKEEAVARVTSLGEVVASFENEPKNANLFSKTWPKAMTFFLDTNSDPKKRVALAKGIVTIPNFRIAPARK